MPADQPIPYKQNEQKQEQIPTYCFVVHFAGVGRNYFTRFDREIVIENLPDSLTGGSGDQKTFTPIQIGHGRIESSAEFNARSIPVSITCTHELRNFFATAAANEIAIQILRVNTSQVLSGDPVNFNDHVWQVGGGNLDTVQITGNILTALVVPSQYQNTQLSRFFWQRPCNHILYSGIPGGCNANKNTFKLDTNIVAWTRSLREIRLEGTVNEGLDFAGGYLEHQASNLRFFITKETRSAGDTYLRLTSWSPELEDEGDHVIAYKGCRHTLEDCEIFDQIENYGGQPFIPSKNPSLHGL